MPTESETDVCDDNAPTAGAEHVLDAGAGPDGTTAAGSVPSMPVRARMVLRVRSVWIFPLAIPLVLVVLMTFIYIGAVLNPTAHLDGLPVMVVNQDSGASVNGQHVDEGDTVVHTLKSSPAVSTKLALRSATLAEAKAEMDRGGAYATIVIPAGFTDSLLAAAGATYPRRQGVPCSPRCSCWRTAGWAVWVSTWRRVFSLRPSNRSPRRSETSWLLTAPPQPGALPSRPRS